MAYETCSLAHRIDPIFPLALILCAHLIPLSAIVSIYGKTACSAVQPKVAVHYPTDGVGD